MIKFSILILYFVSQHDMMKKPGVADDPDWDITLENESSDEDSSEYDDDTNGNDSQESDVNLPQSLPKNKLIVCKDEIDFEANLVEFPSENYCVRRKSENFNKDSDSNVESSLQQTEMTAGKLKVFVDSKPNAFQKLSKDLMF